MSDKDAGTPRVFLYRHGETEWTILGRYTGTTDIPLTPHGRSQVTSTGALVVGPHKLVDPTRLAHVYVSPRKRARETFELAVDERDRETLEREGKVDLKEERLAEWEYGDYEGLVTKEIRALRKKRGLDGDSEWDIWRDGCEGGDYMTLNPPPIDAYGLHRSAAQVTSRLDSLIHDIQSIQGPNMHGEKACDIVLFAHGHLLRAFVKRWLKFPMEFPLSMMLEPGGVGVLSYQHHNVDEPAVLVGIGFPTPSATA